MSAGVEGKGREEMGKILTYIIGDNKREERFRGLSGAHYNGKCGQPFAANLLLAFK